ncbi:hypothetical protein LCGC14_2333180 [marine sediment metagenome]|uniref:Uncharacterized protein n=1 Tax=marine sediment metagenome TaxID=412755 RepID=A0A0F9ERX4_9ZZZZ
MFALVTPAALAQLPQCDDTPIINQNCLFITPPLVCGDFHYNITNMNGDLIENASLTVHNAALNLYQFEFNRTGNRADFQITLCDGTFREVFVGGDSMPLSIVAGELFFLTFIAIITFILLGVGMHIKDPVLSWIGTAGLFVVAAALLLNPFEFLTGKADFIGMTLFGLALILLAIYFLLNSVKMMLNRGDGASEDTEL